VFHFWKRLRGSRPSPPCRQIFSSAPARFERLHWLKAAAVVAAKLAKCDGPVKRSEIRCFIRLFPLDEQEHAAVAPLFNLARESPEGHEPFAGELVRMLGDDLAARRGLFERMVQIGEADGALNRQERDFLERLARTLGVEPLREELSPAAGVEGDPYAVLGVPCDVSDQELRSAWHRLIRRFHPDAAAARGEAGGDHARVASINAAYRRIRSARRQAQA
jgi:DnaJ like chaperone protein